MSQSFSRLTTSDEVGKEFQESIRDKNVFITGVTVGSLGGEVLRVLVRYIGSGTIWIAGRTDSRLTAAAEVAMSEAPTVDIRNVIFDLTSLESIKKGVQPLLDSKVSIDVLILNAAASTGHLAKRTLTADGFEQHFGMNHLAHVLLTSLLLPALRLSAAKKLEGGFPRVVVISSGAHRLNAIRWDDPNFEVRPEEYTAAKAYSHSKTANLLFAREFAERFASEGILAFAATPGLVGETNGVQAFPLEIMVEYGAKNPDGSIPDPSRWKTIQQGAATHIVAGFDPSLKDKSGAYLNDAQVQNELVAPHASDKESARKLWDLSEKALGISLGPSVN